MNRNLPSIAIPVPKSGLVINTPIAPKLAKPIEILYAFFPGRFKAFDFRSP